MDNEILFKNLKSLRKSHKLTQEDVAELIGKDRSLIAKYESGKAVPPLNILKSFARLYNVSVDNLCGEFSESGESLVLAADNKEKSKNQVSFSDLTEAEKELILKLRLSDDDKIKEIFESLSKE